MNPSAIPLHRIQAVIFDLDDTLIDWSGESISWDEFTRPKNNAVYDYLVAQGFDLAYSQDAFSARLRTLISEAWAEAKKNWRGVSFIRVLRQLCQEAGVKLSQIEMQELLQIHNWEPFPGVKLFADTLPVLDDLQHKGYHLGLITNSHLPMWMRDIELEYYGLLSYFPARITSGDTGYMKPHPAIFWRMLGMLGLEPDQAIYVGDRPANDVAGANEVGMVSVWLDLPHLKRELEGIQPNFTITRLRELPTILAQVNENQGYLV